MADFEQKKESPLRIDPVLQPENLRLFSFKRFLSERRGLSERLRKKVQNFVLS